MTTIPPEIIEKEILTRASYFGLRAFALSCKKWARVCRRLFYARINELLEWRVADERFYQCLPNGRLHGITTYFNYNRIYINIFGKEKVTVTFKEPKDHSEDDPELKILSDTFQCSVEHNGEQIEKIIYKVGGIRIIYWTDEDICIPEINTNFKQWQDFINFIRNGQTAFPKTKGYNIEIKDKYNMLLEFTGNKIRHKYGEIDIDEVWAILEKEKIGPKIVKVVKLWAQRKGYD